MRFPVDPQQVLGLNWYRGMDIEMHRIARAEVITSLLIPILTEKMTEYYAPYQIK